MRRLIILVSFGLFFTAFVNAQVITDTLQAGKTFQKSLGAGQTHNYTLNLEKDQFVQLAVEQNEVDVMIRVFLPNGNLLRAFDSPTGSEGTEYAEVVSESAGAYRIEIAAISEADPSASGKYELKVVEWRKATDEELRFLKNESSRQAKGIALVVETSQSFDQFRLPETRVMMRIKAAELLWPSDEKKAMAQMTQAIETVKQQVAERTDSEDDSQHYQWVMALRRQVISALTPHDPEAALKFLQATRLSTEKNDEMEIQLESSLIDRVLTSDPKRAFELAEDLLQRIPSQQLIQTLSQLAQKDRDLATRLAHDMTRKLVGENFLESSQAAYLSTGLLQMAKNPLPPLKQVEGGNQKPARLLSEEDNRALFLKIISELTAYKTSGEAPFGPEYTNARSLAGVISRSEDEVKVYAPDQAAEIKKKISELNGGFVAPVVDLQRYQDAAMKEPIDKALQSIDEAPSGMRDSLYQQVVNRVVASGDVSRARELVSERITNPGQKKQMLQTIQQMAITTAAEKGRFDEALALLAKIGAAERLGMINQIIELIGPRVKRTDAIQYLEQAKNLTSTSIRAENSEQMQTLLAIARVYARHDPHRGFEIVEPLIDQFNEICAAAVTMNGFGGEYYVEGEMTTARDNSLSDIGNNISGTLAILAMYDFDRAKRNADGISRFDARTRTLLIIAGQVLGIHLDDDNGYVGRGDY